MTVAIQPRSNESIVGMLLARVAAEPDTVVYRFLFESRPGQELTYRQLHERAQRVAAALRALHPAPTAAMLVYPSGPDFIAAFFGCLYAGVIAVPAATSRVVGDIRVFSDIAEDSGASVVLTTPSLLDRMSEGVTSGGRGIQFLTVPNDLETAPADIAAAAPHLDDLAYLQYTSGSTASPRGVMVTHRNVLSNLEFIQRDFRHDRSSVAVTWLPHFHDMGLVYGLLQPIYNGFVSIVLSPSILGKSPVKWLETISRNRATHSGGPNFAYDLCVRRVAASARADLDLSSWRVAVNGAEPLRAETLEQFANMFSPCGFNSSAFYPAYGLAEATLKVSGSFLSPSRVCRFNADALRQNRAVLRESDGDTRLVSCGMPRADAPVKIVVVDPDRNVPSVAGAVGEIWVSGDSVAKGYWNRPEETERTFRAFLGDTGEGPFLRTGDLGAMVRGELFITGRLKDLIIIRGENHYPQDVEQTIREAIGCELSAAFAVTVAGEEQAIAICELSPKQAAPGFEGIVSRVRGAVTERHGFSLQTVCFVKAGTLPRTSSGKLQRAKARDAYLSKEMPLVHEDALAESNENTPVEQQVGQRGESPILQRLREIVSLVVRRALSPGDASLALASIGVDSLKAQEIRMLVEKEFARRVSLELLLGGGSLQDIAADIASTTTGVPAEDVVRAEGGEGTEWLPCSPEQARLWYMAALAPESCAYNLAFGLRLRGKLNLDAWDRALAEIEWRHESLRTTFAAIQGVPHRRIGTARRKVIRVADTGNFQASAREDEARRIAEAESRAPFNLESDPMLRALIIRVREDEHIAVFVIHHIASDIQSFQILLGELSEYYETLVQGRPTAWPQVRNLYSRYVDRAWARLSTGESLRDEAFWGLKLNAAPNAAILPFDNPRPAGHAYEAGEVRFAIDDALFNRLNELARSEGVTPFVVYASAFYAVLHRISQQRDLVIGCPVANRPSASLHGVIGLFAHPVPVRVALEGQESLQDLLRSVRVAIIESLEHQELPFSRIVEVSAPADVSTRMPLFSVMFGFHGAVAERFEVSGIEAEAYDIVRAGTDFDLFLDVEASPQGARASLTYNAQIFRRAAIERIVAAYLTVLTQLGVDASNPISTVPLGEALATAVFPVRPEPSTANLVIAATFVAEPVMDVIGWWCRELDVPVTTEIAPLGRLPEQLIDPASALRTNTSGLNVLLIRFQDLPGDRDFFGNLIGFIENAVRRNPIPHVVYICPSAAASQAVVSMEREFADRIRDIPQVEVVTREQLAATYGITNWFDTAADRLASIPYAPEYWAGLATDIVRKAIAYMRTPIKALVVDCDETLWGGICAEDGIPNLAVGPGHRALQERLLDQRRRGVRLCLCSKNNAEDVQEVFDRLPGMLLARTDFDAAKINWSPKSQNVRELARELNFSVDSLVFIDNDMRECAEVAAHHPGINVVSLPAHASQYKTFLEHNWIFDPALSTREGAGRALFYGQNTARESDRRHFTDLKLYIESLDIRVEFRAIDATTAVRASELTYRTTQFNTSGVRWTAGQIVAAAARGELLGITCEVEDRYGSYGLVGLMLLSCGAQAFTIELLALSCRALGRGIEERMMAHVLQLAGQRGYKLVEVPFRGTDRNKPARDFLERVAAEKLNVKGGSDRRYQLEVSQHIDFNPSSTPVESNDGGANALTVAPPANSQRFSIPSEQLNWVASHLTDAAAILQRAQAATKIPRLASVPFSRPANPTEEIVAAVWVEVLNIERVGRLDDFFELGGHSLKAMQILARLNERFDVDLPLDLLFESSPTVADLAKAIDEQTRELSPSVARAGQM
jgi:FkbH-like protein